MAKKKTSSAPPDPAKLSYEQAVAELEQINRRIEEGEIGLEESLTAFRRGMSLAKRCREILDAAEQEVQRISGEDLGETDAD